MIPIRWVGFGYKGGFWLGFWGLGDFLGFCEFDLYFGFELRKEGRERESVCFGVRVESNWG